MIACPCTLRSVLPAVHSTAASPFSLLPCLPPCHPLFPPYQPALHPHRPLPPLSVRRLMLDMHEDCGTWLKFASLCRKSGRVSQSEQTLVRLLADVRGDAEARGLLPLSPGSREPDVMYAWFKHLWATGARQEAFAGVQHLAAELNAAAAALAAAAAAAGEGAVVLPDPAHQLLAAKVRPGAGGSVRI